MLLTIQHNQITTKLYEKILNLYLYISPFSAHSPGVLSGLTLSSPRVVKSAVLALFTTLLVKINSNSKSKKSPYLSAKIIKSIHEWSSLSKELTLERKRDKRSKKKYNYKILLYYINY